jgi:hypothetical protein
MPAMIRMTPIAIKSQPMAGMMVSQRITPMIKAKMPRPTTVDLLSLAFHYNERTGVLDTARGRLERRFAP